MICDKLFTEIDIDESMFHNIDIDIYLDKRDEPPFDTKWISAYEDVRCIRGKLDTTELWNLDELREKVYKLVYTFTQHSELSECISEDFELICLNKLNGNKNSWVLYVFDRYKFGHLPI